MTAVDRRRTSRNGVINECVTKKSALLCFVVAGGGFSEVETVGALNHFVRDVLPSYSHVAESMLRVVGVHAGTVILPELGEKLGAYAQKNWRNEASRSM